MNVYTQLWQLLRPPAAQAPAGLFGTLTACAPVTVSIQGSELREGLYYPRGTVFRREDIGREVALLPCEEGFWILGFVGGEGT